MQTEALLIGRKESVFAHICLRISSPKHADVTRHLCDYQTIPSPCVSMLCNLVCNRQGRGLAAQASATGGSGKRISQNEFTEKAWQVNPALSKRAYVQDDMRAMPITAGWLTACCAQAIVAAPEIAKNAGQQIVETEHLFKALLEQPNGLARRILSKVGLNPSNLLEKTDQFIRKQPRVSGDAQQVTLN